MSLVTLTFDQFVTNFLNALAVQNATLTDTTEGSVLRALAEAVSGNAISLQGEILQVADLTRLSTSTGTDVDSFVNDYRMYRLPAVMARGQVTLSRNLVGSLLTVAVGSAVLVQTSVGLVQFEVVGDPVQSAWNPGTGTYEFGVGVSNILVTVQAVVPGRSGNVQPHQINQIVAGLPGVSSVSNALAFLNGQDTETDAQVKARFAVYILGLPDATIYAIMTHIQQVQVGLTFQILDLKHSDLTPYLTGGFAVIVDDGSRAIGAPLLDTIRTSINQTKAAGIGFDLVAPVNVSVDTKLNVVATTPAELAAVKTAVAAAIASFISARPVGVSVLYDDVENAVQQVPGVFAYSNLRLNNLAADVNIALNQIAEAGTVTFT